MPSVRFLQLSDLHLGSSLGSGKLSLPADKARLRRSEINEVFAHACRLVEERGLDLVLMPGDLFDDEAVSQDAINLVIDHLSRLAPVPVMIAPGNHDFYSLGSPYNDDLLRARRQPTWPGNVHIFKDGRWSSHAPPRLPGVTVTAMAHCANTLLDERLLARPVPAGDPAPETIRILLFHGSRDNVDIPSGKMRTLPFSDEELAAQPFDYAAVGHYHRHAVIHRPDGSVAGAYSGCPAGRGLDEEGDKIVLVGEIAKEGDASRVSLESVRLDRRAVRRLRVDCHGITHQEALQERVARSVADLGAAPEDMVHIALEGHVAPGVEFEEPDLGPDTGFFHLQIDLTGLKPGYDLERYRDENLRTTEALFAREMMARIEAETDHGRRLVLENALHYGLDALLQGRLGRRYEQVKA